MPVKRYLFVFLLVLTVTLAIFGVYFWYSSKTLQSGNSELNSAYKGDIYIKSEVSGAEFEFSNKKSLGKFLQEFGFWDGMVAVGGLNIASEDFIRPKTLIIHISNEKYNENRTDWTGGIYVSATKAEFSGDGTFHLWIGLNEGFFDGKYSGLENWIDFQLLTAIFTRSKKTIKNPQVVLDDHINEKVKTQPFIIMKKMDK